MNVRYNPRMPAGGKVILIVEDDDDLRRMFRQALVFAGFHVSEAGDGPAALRQIDAQRPDLIVLDLMLPTMSGAEVAAQAHSQNIPIVVVTGSASEVDAVACVLRKPVTPERLVRTVRLCLGSGARGVRS